MVTNHSIIWYGHQMVIVYPGRHRYSSVQLRVYHETRENACYRCFLLLYRAVDEFTALHDSIYMILYTIGSLYKNRYNFTNKLFPFLIELIAWEWKTKKFQNSSKLNSSLFLPLHFRSNERFRWCNITKGGNELRLFEKLRF